eukprot:1157052-Pelagomonas_calceolata.AAC.5
MRGKLQPLVAERHGGGPCRLQPHGLQGSWRTGLAAARSNPTVQEPFAGRVELNGFEGVGDGIGHGVAAEAAGAGARAAGRGSAYHAGGAGVLVDVRQMPEQATVVGAAVGQARAAGCACSWKGAALGSRDRASTAGNRGLVGGGEAKQGGVHGA